MGLGMVADDGGAGYRLGFVIEWFEAAVRHLSVEEKVVGDW